MGMEEGQLFLICFGLFNLALLSFCRSLAGPVHRFFILGHRAFEKRKPGDFPMVILGKAPTRKQVTRLLASMGGLNALGCLVGYLLIF